MTRLWIAILAATWLPVPALAQERLEFRAASEALPEGGSRGDGGLLLRGEDRRPLDLTQRWRPSERGALTVLWELTLTEEPGEKKPVVGRWELSDGGRAFELGIRPDRRPYFSISESGRWDEHAAEITGTRRLALANRYVLAAVFEPAVALRLYVNGEPAGVLRRSIPKSRFATQTPLWLGARHPGELYLSAIVGDGLIEESAWTRDRISEWSTGRLLAPAPPEELTFEQRLHAQPWQPKIERLTDGPLYHWFGYYDKAQVDPSGRYVLSMEVSFEDRSPRPDDAIGIGIVDLENENAWREIGTSRAWSWQQGCMLQWRPGSVAQVMWNDREDGRFVMRLLDLDTGEVETFDRPLYHASPDGRRILSTDFRRIQDMRPGYGYPGIPDPNRDLLAPEDEGIWLVDLETREERLILSMATIAAVPYPGADPENDKHYVNHVQWAPGGERFFFLDRWRSPKFGGFRTRAFTAAADGSDLRVLSDQPGLSHFTWDGDGQVLIWRGGAYRVFPDDGQRREIDLLDSPDGHVSLLKSPWAVTDTYPHGPDREQRLYLWHRESHRLHLLAELASPPRYRGELRCDLHPRVCPDGRSVIVDSTHEGLGRQLYRVTFDELSSLDGTK